MNLRRYKVQFPREQEDAEFQEGLVNYERERLNFNVCRFIEQSGAKHPVGDVVRLHDEITGIASRQPLA